MTSTNLHLLVLGAFDPDYPRHAILIAGLQAHGAQVTAAHLPKNASTLQRMRLALRHWRQFRRYDALLIPAFNQTLAPFVWLLALFTGSRVWLDYMVGLSDVSADRGVPSSIKRFIFRQIDRFNITQLHTFTDTAAHRDWFARNLHVSTKKMRVLPVGVKPDWFDAPPLPPCPPLTVGFIGTFIPFQGVDVILQAAALLRDQPQIEFLLIGGGQTYQQMRQLAEALNLQNVEFQHGYFNLEQLMPLVARCSVLSGVFGDAAKTSYVIPKVFDGLAAGRVVITAESRALGEQFTPGTHLLTIAPGDAGALATALQGLLAQPEQIAPIGAAGAARVREAFQPEHIAAQFVAWLKD
jgi:glycosyltransferase involved in cell wall biosynthesis